MVDTATQHRRLRDAQLTSHLGWDGEVPIANPANARDHYADRVELHNDEATRSANTSS